MTKRTMMIRLIKCSFQYYCLRISPHTNKTSRFGWNEESLYQKHFKKYPNIEEGRAMFLTFRYRSNLFTVTYILNDLGQWELDTPQVWVRAFKRKFPSTASTQLAITGSINHMLREGYQEELQC